VRSRIDLGQHPSLHTFYCSAARAPIPHVSPEAAEGGLIGLVQDGDRTFTAPALGSGKT
jgi:hypothetical protein